MHSFTAFPIQPVHHTPFQKTQITIFSVKYDMYIEVLSQIHTLLQPIVVIQELNHVLEIPKFHI